MRRVSTIEKSVRPLRRVATTQKVCLQSEVERLEQLVEAEAARGDYILEAAQENIDGFAQAMDQHALRHQRRRQADLQRQRQALARAAAEELVQERRQRMTALKEASRRPVPYCLTCFSFGRRGVQAQVQESRQRVPSQQHDVN